MSRLPHQPCRSNDRRVPGAHCPTSLAKLVSSSFSDVAVQRPWLNWVYLKGGLEMKGGGHEKDEAKTRFQSKLQV